MSKKTPRHALLAAIHVAKKQLGLSEGDYREFLFSRTGRESCRDCTDVQLRYVLDGMRALGWGADRPQRREYTPLQLKVRALWRQLYVAGQTDGSATNLNRWVNRQYGVDRLEWLTQEQAQKAVEALKKWYERVSKNTGGNDDQ